MRKRNVDQYFENPEITIESNRTNEYDLTIKEVEFYLQDKTDQFFRKEDGSFNHFAYNIGMVQKYKALSDLEKVDFLVYQALLHKNHKKWLIEFDKLIKDNSGPSDDGTVMMFFQLPEGHNEAMKEAILNLKEKNEVDLSGLSKIKTDLTVTQIGYLVRALMEIGLIDSKNNKMDIARIFAQIFAPKSKKGQPISVDKIYNVMKKSTTQDADFWDEKFLHLKQFAKKDR